MSGKKLAKGTEAVEGFVNAQMAEDNPHGFKVGSMVEVPMSEGLPRFGVIRWIGIIPQLKDKLVAGLESVKIINK
ncbi:ubiquitin carboxyl-terminal hydrolase CYLD-like [Orbicella faveolata]|uniref:ubiquitin carboxyl-terminal hydrolase CYLD-like n=1 Tax=Orbicella faveolata TaxID=48498 RepID=UPI0009E25C44|nr:ubiquitin carboxyl-terminal hydrolase CYLD-like [Orbicella faveolata]